MSLIINHPSRYIANGIDNLMTKAIDSKYTIVKFGYRTLSTTISVTVFPVFLALELILKRMPKLIISVALYKFSDSKTAPELQKDITKNLAKMKKFASGILYSPLGLMSADIISRLFLKTRTIGNLGKEVEAQLIVLQPSIEDVSPYNLPVEQIDAKNQHFAIVPAEPGVETGSLQHDNIEVNTSEQSHASEHNIMQDAEECVRELPTEQGAETAPNKQDNVKEDASTQHITNPQQAMSPRRLTREHTSLPRKGKPAVKATLDGKEVLFVQVGQGKAKNVYQKLGDNDHVYITLTSSSKIGEVRKEVAISQIIEERLYDRFVKEITLNVIICMKKIENSIVSGIAHDNDKDVVAVIKALKQAYPNKKALNDFLQTASDKPLLSEELCQLHWSNALSEAFSHNISNLGRYTATDYQDISTICQVSTDVAHGAYALKADKAEMDLTKLLFSGENHLSFEQAFNIGFDVLAGIRDMHRAGFVHGDIKPDNFLIMKGRAKVADFGKSQQLSRDDQIVTYAGNPRYIGPGVGLSKKSEAYSVGLVLCQIFDALHKSIDGAAKKADENKECAEKSDFSGLVKALQENKQCIQANVRNSNPIFFYACHNSSFLVFRESRKASTTEVARTYVTKLFEDLHMKNVVNKDKLDQIRDIIIALLDARSEKRIDIESACKKYLQLFE